MITQILEFRRSSLRLLSGHKIVYALSTPPVVKYTRRSTMIDYKNAKRISKMRLLPVAIKLACCLLIFQIVIATMILNAPTLRAQSASEVWRLNHRNTGVGVRMTGMSVRGFAGLGDHSALYSNPSGLGYIAASELIVTLRGSTTSDNSLFGGSLVEPSDQFRSDGFTLGRTNSREDKLVLGDIVYVYDAPVGRGKLVAALGLSRVRDFSTRLEFIGENSKSTISESFLPFNEEYTVDNNGNLDELSDLSFAAFNAGVIEYYRYLYEDGEYPFLSAVIPGSTIEQSAQINGSGGVYELSGGVAWQASTNLMAGASLNVSLGSYDFDYSFTESDVLNENTTEDYNVLNDDGSLFEGFDQLNYRQTLETGMAGFNVRAGVSADLTRLLRVGVSIETPTWTFIEETYTEEFSTRFDSGGSLSYGDRPDDLGNGFFEYSTRSPWRFGAGLTLLFYKTPIGNIVLTGEAEILDWSRLKLRYRDDRNFFSDVNNVIENDLDIVLNYALGAELEINRAFVRFGFGVRPSPFTNSSVSNFIDDYSENQRGVSFGFGYRMTSKILLNLGIQLTDSIPELWEVYPSDAQGTRQDTFFEIDQIQNQNVFVLGLSMNI